VLVPSLRETGTSRESGKLAPSGRKNTHSVDSHTSFIQSSHTLIHRSIRMHAEFTIGNRAARAVSLGLPPRPRSGGEGTKPKAGPHAKAQSSPRSGGTRSSRQVTRRDGHGSIELGGPAFRSLPAGFAGFAPWREVRFLNSITPSRRFIHVSRRLRSSSARRTYSESENSRSARPPHPGPLPRSGGEGTKQKAEPHAKAQSSPRSGGTRSSRRSHVGMATAQSNSAVLRSDLSLLPLRALRLGVRLAFSIRSRQNAGSSKSHGVSGPARLAGPTMNARSTKRPALSPWLPLRRERGHGTGKPCRALPASGGTGIALCQFSPQNRSWHTLCMIVLGD
jgi:hypothetical protein